jgi:hypothetical protein
MNSLSFATFDGFKIVIEDSGMFMILIDRQFKDDFGL